MNDINITSTEWSGPKAPTLQIHRPAATNFSLPHHTNALHSTSLHATAPRLPHPRGSILADGIKTPQPRRILAATSRRGRNIPADRGASRLPRRSLPQCQLPMFLILPQPRRFIQTDGGSNTAQPSSIRNLAARGRRSTSPQPNTNSSPLKHVLIIETKKRTFLRVRFLYLFN